MAIVDYNVKQKTQWCIGCVLPDTLVHTNPDIVEIKDLKNGDKVLGYDGNYHIIKEIMKHHHTGKMYKLYIKNFGTCDLTHEHPIYISRRKHKKLHNTHFTLEWAQADDVNVGDYVAYPIPKIVTDIKQIKMSYEIKEMDRKSNPLPEYLPVNDKLMRLFGYYLSEGHIQDRKITFTFNIKETDYVKDIEEIVLSLFNLRITKLERTEKNIVDVNICSSVLAREFYKLFNTGALNKKIPHFVMLLPPEKQKELIKALWRGDGWVSETRTHYKTISKVLCHQIKLLLLRQGIVPCLITEEPYEHHKKAYAIYVIESTYFNKLMNILEINYKKEDNTRQLTVKDDNYVYLPIRKIETYNYNGMVHNLEVYDSESYVTDAATLHNCGDFGILMGIKSALNELALPTKDVVIASGVGCSSKIPHYINTYGYEGLHGRLLPLASGIKIANRKLTVVAMGGDGDGYGEGAQHFVHICRRNYNITYIVHNNEVYGLTTGQASPTTKQGVKTPTTPFGNNEIPFNPMAAAIVNGATFVARTWSGDIKHMKKTMVEAIKHKGFSLVDVFQPCVTYNKHNSYEWYQSKVYDLEESGHSPSNKLKAIEKAYEDEQNNYEKIPIGVFYKELRPCYEDLLPHLEQKELVDMELDKIDITELCEELM